MPAQIPTASLDFIYLDPPFFTNRDFAGKERKLPKGESTPLAFPDRWLSTPDAHGRQLYLSWLEHRIRALRPLLAPTGVFLLHLDWHVVHYAKVLCDQIFGEDHFQNELIWYYQTGGASKERFSRKHDTILLYSSGPTFPFNGKAIAIPRTPKSMKRARSGKGARIAATDTHKNPDDVLLIPALNPMAIERTGYPTQKPLKLLETLIRSLTPDGGSVADFFCGSGTTLLAAKNLGRSYIGCDQNPAAVKLTKKRLARTDLPP